MENPFQGDQGQNQDYQDQREPNQLQQPQQQYGRPVDQDQYQYYQAPNQQQPQQQYQPQQPYQQYGNPMAAEQYQRGCAGSAWYDVRTTKGWFPKMLFLGLLQSVPILNWIVPGFAMKWAADATDGSADRNLNAGWQNPMPKKVFTNGAFTIGFYWFVFSLVVACAVSVGLSIISSALVWIPIIGALAAFAASMAIAIFLVPYQYMCGMRTAMSGRLGPAFNLKAAWQAFTRRLGSLWCSTVLPQWIVLAIVYTIASIIVLCFAGALLFVLINLAVTYSMDSYFDPYTFEYLYAPSIFDIDYSPYVAAANSHHYDLSDFYEYYQDPSYLFDEDTVSSIIGSGLLALLGLTIAYYIINVGAALAIVLSFRGAGYYIARYASDWNDDPSLMGNPYKGIPNEPGGGAQYYYGNNDPNNYDNYNPMSSNGDVPVNPSTDGRSGSNPAVSVNEVIKDSVKVEVVEMPRTDNAENPAATQAASASERIVARNSENLDGDQ